jgi:hypothetical protein
MPGGVPTAVVGALAASFLLVWSFYDTGRSLSSGIPAEWWVLGTWGVLGVIFWWLARDLRARVSPAERQKLISGGAN